MTDSTSLDEMERLSSGETRDEARARQAALIARLNATRARMLAEMSDEERAHCLTLDCWKTEEEKSALGLATPVLKSGGIA